VTYFNKALKAGYFEPALIGRASAYMLIGQLDSALTDYSAVLARDSRSADALFGRASVYIARQQRALALDDLNAAIALAPDPRFSTIALALRAHVFEDAQEYTKAGDDFFAAGRISPTTPSLFFHLAGLMYEKANQNGRAVAVLSQAIDLDPHDADLYQSRGRMYKKQRDLGRALSDYTTSVRLAPTDVDQHQSLADLLDTMGQKEAALDEDNEVVRLAPDSAESYVARAQIFTELGRDVEARRDYAEAERIAPGTPRLVHSRMQFLFYQGDYAGAVADANAWLAAPTRSKDPVNVAYTLLWRHIAMQRQRIDDRADLEAATSPLPIRDQWPYPLIEFSLTRIDETQLLAAASRGDPITSQEHLCEANAYIGERYASHGQNPQAKSAFQTAMAICPVSFIEHDLAIRGLKQIATALGQAGASVHSWKSDQHLSTATANKPATPQ